MEGWKNRGNRQNGEERMKERNVERERERGRGRERERREIERKGER